VVNNSVRKLDDLSEPLTNTLKKYLFFELGAVGVLFTFAVSIYALDAQRIATKVFARFFAQRCQPYNSHVWFGSRYLHIFCRGFLHPPIQERPHFFFVRPQWTAFFIQDATWNISLKATWKKIIFWTWIRTFRTWFYVSFNILCWNETKITCEYASEIISFLHPHVNSHVCSNN
jgi:hypothetical protein